MKAFNSTLNQVSKKREASGKPAGLKTRRGLKAKHGLKSKSHLKPVSKKRKEAISNYTYVVERIKKHNYGLRSELSGKMVGVSLQTHHIMGRVGRLFSDPFNLIELSPEEHEYYTNGGGCNREAKLALLAFIRPIRIKQGFIEKEIANG